MEELFEIMESCNPHCDGNKASIYSYAYSILRMLERSRRVRSNSHEPKLR